MGLIRGDFRIMFPVNLAVWAYLKSRWYRAPSTVQDAEVSAEKD